MNTQNILTEEQLHSKAPSIFATRPWEGVSAKYAFIPTIDIVRRLTGEGFVPVQASQSRARIAGKADFAKHLLRFRDIRQLEGRGDRRLGQLFPEIVLTNSHDCGSAFILHVGILRLVCLNGLIVASGGFEPISVRHSGRPENIIEAAFKVVDQFPAAIESAERFGRLLLTPPQRQAYATAALDLRYDEGKAPITVEQLLKPVRPADEEPTAWNTFNTVQEKLVGGGVRGRVPVTGRRTRTRAVTGVSENTRLNKALWTLTEKLAELVAA